MMGAIEDRVLARPGDDIGEPIAERGVDRVVGVGIAIVALGVPADRDDRLVLGQWQQRRDMPALGRTAGLGDLKDPLPVDLADRGPVGSLVRADQDVGNPVVVEIEIARHRHARAHRITTPTLVLHSESDFRCHVEQGQQLFTLLYKQGVETELLLFPPGEGHELSRSGTPKHRLERFEAILDWHGRFLGDR